MKAEPVLIERAIQAIATALVLFFASWSPEQKAAVMVAILAVGAVVVRQLVTPATTTKTRK